MNKTQIIKKIVGEKLKDYGFTFFKTDGPCRIFIREAQGFKRYYTPETDAVKQYIIIQQHRFANAVTARFETDVSNKLVGTELEILSELNLNGSEWFEYSDEEEYEKVLAQLAEIIIKYGLDFLCQMSIEDEITPTKAMADELYKNHRELDERFIRKYKMNPVPQSLSDIEEWFRQLGQMIIAATEKPYEEVKELLVEVAAFIGERNCEILGEKWFFEEELKTPYTQGENHQGFCFLPLREVVIHYRDYKEDKKTARTELWFWNEIDELKKAFQKNR